MPRRPQCGRSQRRRGGPGEGEHPVMTNVTPGDPDRRRIGPTCRCQAAPANCPHQSRVEARIDPERRPVRPSRRDHQTIRPPPTLTPRITWRQCLSALSGPRRLSPDTTLTGPIQRSGPSSRTWTGGNMASITAFSAVSILPTTTSPESPRRPTLSSSGVTHATRLRRLPTPLRGR